MSRKRKLWLTLLAGLVIALVGAGFAAQGTIAYAKIATTYAAKQTCSCLHVSGRAMDSCLADFPADARSQINVTAEGERIRATALFGLFKAEALYDEQFGCSIANN